MFRAVHFFVYQDTAAPDTSTLSLHDALPISPGRTRWGRGARSRAVRPRSVASWRWLWIDPSRFPTTESDRKSTRLNSSHMSISYAVFCLKKKTQDERNHRAIMQVLR